MSTKMAKNASCYCTKNRLEIFTNNISENWIQLTLQISWKFHEMKLESFASVCFEGASWKTQRNQQKQKILDMSKSPKYESEID